MSRDQAKEELRQVYQRAEARYQAYIPAKPKVNLYGDEHVFRVCAYCRVSTENDEQLSSFELQQSHYKQLVMDHPNWELKHIYADEGISGTSLKNRDQFNEMIAACRRGEYQKAECGLRRSDKRSKGCQQAGGNHLRTVVLPGLDRRCMGTQRHCMG